MACFNPRKKVEKSRVAISYDYNTAGVDYHVGTKHHIDGQHYVLGTDEEIARWSKDNIN